MRHFKRITLVTTRLWSRQPTKSEGGRAPGCMDHEIEKKLLYLAYTTIQLIQYDTLHFTKNLELLTPLPISISKLQELHPSFARVLIN